MQQDQQHFPSASVHASKFKCGFTKSPEQLWNNKQNPLYNFALQWSPILFRVQPLPLASRPNKCLFAMRVRTATKRSPGTHHRILNSMHRWLQTGKEQNNRNAWFRQMENTRKLAGKKTQWRRNPGYHWLLFVLFGGNDSSDEEWWQSCTVILRWTHISNRKIHFLLDSLFVVHTVGLASFVKKRKN